MNIFMTGATGFIGKNIAAKLIDQGNVVTALLLPEEPESLLNGLDISVVRGDITNPATLAGKMFAQDAIIHLAGLVGYGQKMEACKRVNRDGTYNVAHEATRAGIRRFIHFSSVSVYGRVPDVPIREDFPRKKIGDPYGDTKFEAENILTDLCAQGKLDLTMVRPSVIYGPGDDKFLPKLIENLKSGRARIIGSGRNTVDLIHVSDVADFIALLIRDTRSIGQVYNLTNPDNPTWKEFLEIIARELGIAPLDKYLPYPVAIFAAALMELVARVRKTEPRLTVYSVKVIGRQYHYITKKYQEELEFMPSIDLRMGIREVVRQTLTPG